MAREVVFEVSEIRPILCSYPGCERINGKVRRARWMIRRVGSEQEARPVCFICKSEIKRYLGADEQRAARRRGSAEGGG